MTGDFTHDLHVHTYLSSCCRDKANMTVPKVVAAAAELGLTTVGFSDHVWMNEAVPLRPGIARRMPRSSRACVPISTLFENAASR